MNTLIVESGATKTDWVIVGQKIVYLPPTSGLNPYHTSPAQIETIVEKQVLAAEVKIDRIYFYGSGCRSENDKLLIRNSLRKYFKPLQIYIYDDMQALVHSCEIRDGLGLILGTGSNACKIVDGKIGQQMSSSGFILGDEGSGSYLAKSLLKDYIEYVLPPELGAAFEQMYNLDRSTCLNLFYSYPIDKSAIGQYSKFIQSQIEHPHLQSLVLEGFRAFLNRLKLQNFELKGLPCFCVGGVGFIFQNLLEQALELEGASLQEAVKTPLPGLIKWVQANPN